MVVPLSVAATPLPVNCGQLTFSEIGAYFDDQFIELYNGGDIENDLTGCKIVAEYGKSANSYQFLESDNNKIAGGSYFVINLKETTLKLTKNPTVARNVQLFDIDGALVDEISYDSQSVNKSWSFIGGKWLRASPTPGQPNESTKLPDPVQEPGDPADPGDPSDPELPQTDCEAIAISEIGANLDNPFIEIINLTNYQISLDGCGIATDRNSKQHPFSDKTLDPGDVDIMQINGSDIKKTVAGSVTLIDLSADTEILKVDYPALKKGTSWALVDDDWMTLKTPSPSEYNRVEPVNFCKGLSISEIAANTNEQFIELVNSSAEAMNTKGCLLMTNRSSTKSHELTEANLQPSQFLVVKVADTKLTLTKTTTGDVYILSSDGENEIDRVAYKNLASNTSWAAVEDSWAQTYKLTPGEKNIFQEYPECQSGYYRNLETGRCNKTVLPTVLPDCPAGQYRNLETNRCRKIAASTNSLTPCKSGYERNPATNRCRKIVTTSSELKPCAAGYERNPATNRCRKIKNDNEPTFAVAKIEPSHNAPTLWIASAIVLALTSVVIAWQYRMEIGHAIKNVSNKLFVRA